MRKNIITLLLLLASFVVSHAYAQEIAEKPCDTKYWEQITHRAWLETEREIMQNQNLIFKPDSVLAYTCFDQFANIAAAQGGEIFVHTNYFGEIIIQRGRKESTDQGINAVVTLPLKGYRVNNFPDTFLGGRATHYGVNPTAHAYQNPSGGASASYNCSNMSTIWQAAKCANFIHSDRFKQTDGFYPFETIKGLDGQDVVGYKGEGRGGDSINETREFPKPCTGGTGVISWTRGVINAENRGETLYEFQTPLGRIFKEVNEKIEPGSCASRGIPTGLTVITVQGQQGKDGVCTNPGCTYTHVGGDGACQDIGEAPL